MDNHSGNKQFWERFAGVYSYFMKTKARAYKALCKEIEEYISDTDDVLELACGTGQMTFHLADKAKRWTATDFSPKMIAVASKRNKNLKVQFLVQDATRLVWEGNSFDVIVIANALHIMPNPDKALAEIHRVLKPNGILYAPTFVYGQKASKAFIWLAEKVGFHTFHKWTCAEYAAYVRQYGFVPCKHTLIMGKPLPISALICRKWV